MSCLPAGGTVNSQPPRPEDWQVAGMVNAASGGRPPEFVRELAETSLGPVEYAVVGAGDRAQVDAGGEQLRRAVVPDRVQAGADAELADHARVAVGDPARAAGAGVVGLVGEHEPLLVEPAPSSAHAAISCSRCSVSRATVAASSEIRRLWWVLVPLIVVVPPCSLTLCRIVRTPAARSRFSQRSASTSPRRAPVTSNIHTSRPQSGSSAHAAATIRAASLRRRRVRVGRGEPRLLRRLHRVERHPAPPLGGRVGAAEHRVALADRRRSQWTAHVRRAPRRRTRAAAASGAQRTACRRSDAGRCAARRRAARTGAGPASPAPARSGHRARAG